LGHIVLAQRQLKQLIFNSWATLIINHRASGRHTKVIGTPAVDGWGGLLHLVQRGWDWTGCHPAQPPPHCTKCNSPPINGQCTNFLLFDWNYNYLCTLKRLTTLWPENTRKVINMLQ